MNTIPSHRARSPWTRVLGRICRTRSVILGYHGVASVARKDDLFLLQLSPPRFRAQLQMLLAAGFQFVTVAELARRAAGGPPPPGLAAVSFDDGLRNNLTTAMPILRQLRIRATVYVPTDWIGGENPWIGAGAGSEILSKTDVRELVAEGWEVGSHTLSHADLSLLDYAACRREIDESRGALERITGVSVETLAYPFGHYGPVAVNAARDSGLLAAVTTGSGLWDPFELTRAMIGSADPWPIVLLKLTDRYEPLLRAKPLAFVRQKSKQLRSSAGRMGTRDDGGDTPGGGACIPGGAARAPGGRIP